MYFFFKETCRIYHQDHLPVGLEASSGKKFSSFDKAMAALKKHKIKMPEPIAEPKQE